MELKKIQVTEVLYNHEKKRLTIIFNDGSVLGYTGTRAVKIFIYLNNFNNGKKQSKT